MTPPPKPDATNDGVGTSALFCGKVRDYLAARPDYPPALLDALAADGALTPGCDVADLGAGTGVLTAALVARGYRVTAVEPNAEMRAACDERLGGRPGYASRAGSAEATGLPAQSVDLLTAAQAFHWFDVAPARAEALRVLRPHGQVALIWNDREPTDPLQQALDALFDQYGGAARQAMLAQDDRSKVPLFFGHAPAQRRFPNEHRLPLAGLQSLVFSRSYMPRHDSPTAAPLADAVTALFHRFAQDGQVVVRYRTLLVVGRPSAEGASVQA